MAKRERIKMDDYEIWGLNVSDTVGIGGANKTDDVMLVQAMFNYLASLDRLWVTGAKSRSEIPAANGNYDSKLGRLILNFQKSKFYLLMSIDGVIHPASYQNRNIKFVTGTDKKLMTITLLHTELDEATETGIDYTTAILRQFPGLGVWIR